ncbi:MAG: PQQ-binding-like beta-propeller repeat protein [candidate division WOR-3 bacterium]
MKLLIIFLFNFYVKGYLSPDSTSIKIDYHLGKGVSKIEVVYEYKGKNYIVAEHRNLYPEKELKDEFIWFTNGKWRKDGNLKLIVFYNNKKREEYFISGRNLQIADFLSENSFKKEENLIEIKRGHYINPSLIKQYNGPDPYSWRVVGYNPQHTGYYPFPLHPPLKLKWKYYWGGGGTWTTMISGCAGHGMLFIGRGNPEWNMVMAKDLNTGKTIWEKTLTSNVWTSMLCEGDSILFVGTTIGIPPESLPTFFALDPLTGKEKWSKILGHTVEFMTTADTMAYPATGDGDTVYAMNLKGKLAWKNVLTSYHPVYWDKKIYGPKECNPFNPNDTLYIFYCRDALTGDSIWGYRWSYFDISLWQSIYSKKIFFLNKDTLLCLNAFNGTKVWYRTPIPPSLTPLTIYDNKIYHSRGKWMGDTIIVTQINVFSAFDGKDIWAKTFIPSESVGGRALYSPLSYKDILWVNNREHIYVLNAQNGDSLYEIPAPEWSREPSKHFPIIYKNFFLIGNNKYIGVYEGDTTSLPSSYTFNFYPFYKKDSLYFYLSLPFETYVRITLYDVAGRKISDIFSSLFQKGVHKIPVNTKNLPAGNYLIYLESKKFKNFSKILVFKK